MAIFDNYCVIGYLTESSDVDIYYEGETQGLLSLPFEKRIGRIAGKSGGYHSS